MSAILLRAAAMQFLAVLAFAILLAPIRAAAQGSAPPDGAAQPEPAAAAPADVGLSDGEVRRVDKDAQKVSLRHGPIPHLGMGEMTMVFRVADPAWLDALKFGDRIRFRAEKVGGLFTITAIEGMR